MVTEDRPTEQWGPRPGEDWRAHRMRVFADYPEHLAVLRVAESREHEAEIWREWHVASSDSDPDLLELARRARYDLEAPPEEDEDDIRFIRNKRGGADARVMQKFWSWFERRFPDQVNGRAADA